MASVATTPKPTTTTPEVAKKRKARPAGPKTPWWMWIVIAAIVVFCLFPFYWLINISLKTGCLLYTSDAADE